MNKQSTEYKRKIISRSVYGLLAMVIFVFLLILIVIQIQNNEAERLEQLANDYHLNISEKSLSILNSITEIKLWFRNYYIENKEAGSAGERSSVSLVNMKFSPRDKLDAFKYELDKYIKDSTLIQGQFPDPEFKNINLNLAKSYIKVKSDIEKVKARNSITYKMVDTIIAPLHSVTDQLYRLHKYEYQEVHHFIESNKKTNLLQIIGLVVMLTIVGLFSVVRMLRHTRNTLLELTTANKEIEYSQARFESMFESLSDAVIVTDLEFNLTLVNSSAERMFGYTKEELLGNKANMLYGHSEDYSQITKETYRMNEEGEVVPYEIEYCRKDGSLFWGELVREKFSSENGTVFGYVGIIRDVTERKHAEMEIKKHREHLEVLVNERTQELNDAQDELVRKERLATLGQLTATVSHELRNPLGAMRPSLYVIEKKSDKGDERLQNAIARVDRNIDRCDRIIDELLDYTRITELNLKSTRIDQWLKSVIDEQPISEGIQIEKDFGLKDIQLYIDSDRLRRAIINVIENACHAMMDDNQQLVNKEDSSLIINTGATNERVEISISDTGSGIEKNILDKVFEPLFSTKGFGVGLGMPTVKQIMEQHNGGVELNSKQGKGTTVTLWLSRDIVNSNNDGVAA